jgi:hypothetical protein
MTLLAVGVQVQKKVISYIETTKSWYYIFDGSGKKIVTPSPVASAHGYICGTKRKRKSERRVRYKKVSQFFELFSKSDYIIVLN